MRWTTERRHTKKTSIIGTGRLDAKSPR